MSNLGGSRLSLSIENRVEHYILLSHLLATPADIVALRDYFSERKDSSVLTSLLQGLAEWGICDNDGCAVHREYANLFLLPGGVKPYESVYLSDEQLLMQEPWVKVREFYRKCGWQLQNTSLPEDHASVELSFMAHLLSREGQAEADRFFQEHVVQWIPQLLQDIQNNRHAGFYRSVSGCGRTFLEMEEKYYRKEDK